MGLAGIVTASPNKFVMEFDGPGELAAKLARIMFEHPWCILIRNTSPG